MARRKPRLLRLRRGDRECPSVNAADPRHDLSSHGDFNAALLRHWMEHRHHYTDIDSYPVFFFCYCGYVSTYIVTQAWEAAPAPAPARP